MSSFCGSGNDFNGKIYVASSWRNEEQPNLIEFLRKLDFDVYDFRNPEPGNVGFHWSEIDEDWLNWTPNSYRKALQHPIAIEGFTFDFNAMKECDICILLLPSGRSASFEFGWCKGQNKRCIVFMPEKCEPELMYLGCEICISYVELEITLSRRGHTGEAEPLPVDIRKDVL